MERRNFIKSIGITTVLSSVTKLNAMPSKSRKSVKRNSEKPNIIYIMADDLGKEWISCYGSEELKTENIDKLAKTGMKFENFYCMPQCTPTRASLLTGKYPCNHGFVNHWDVPRWGGGCSFDPGVHPSIGNVMKSVGYKTVIAGKWQLDDFRVEPEACVDAGFDEYFMWTGGETENLEKSEKRYYDPYIQTKEGSKIYKGKFGPELYTDFLLDFLDKNRKDPMFVYFPMCLPHGPNTATPLKPNVTGKDPQYIAMVEYVDYCLKRIVDKVDELGIRKDTIIIWTTDNGSGGTHKGIRNGRKIKGGKGTNLEQNVNVPFIVNCPGKVPSGVVTDALSDLTDMLPTFAELGGAELPLNHSNDGTSIADLLLGKVKDTKRKWIMAMGGKNRAKMTDKGPENEWYWRDRIIRNKQYKLIIGTDKKPFSLFDILNDPAETKNLVDSNDPKIINAKQELFNVIYQFPEKDNDFVCRPTPPQKWDRKVEAKSEIWKLGRPE